METLLWDIDSSRQVLIADMRPGWKQCTKCMIHLYTCMSVSATISTVMGTFSNFPYESKTFWHQSTRKTVVAILVSCQRICVVSLPSTAWHCVWCCVPIYLMEHAHLFVVFCSYYNFLWINTTYLLICFGIASLSPGKSYHHHDAIEVAMKDMGKTSSSTK